MLCVSSIFFGFLHYVYVRTYNTHKFNFWFDYIAVLSLVVTLFNLGKVSSPQHQASQHFPFPAGLPTNRWHWEDNRERADPTP